MIGRPDLRLRAAFARPSGQREWRATQESIDHIKQKIELLPDSHSAVDAVLLRSRLLECGLPDYVRVEVQLVSRLTPDLSTGKFRRRITKVAPAA